jgi:hypothetical protein
LNFHAKISLENTKTRNWINEEKYQTFIDWNNNLSENALQFDFDGSKNKLACLN